MNIYFIAVITIIIFEFLIFITVETLNLRHSSPEIPDEMKDIYNQERYQLSQNYLKDNTKFDIIKTFVFTPITLLFITLNGFPILNNFVKGFGFGEIVSGLIFIELLSLGLWVINEPFSLYRTFVIEAKYGFNRTTPKTYLKDKVKSGLLSLVIGTLILSVVQYFFINTGNFGWLYCWLAITVFQLLMMLIVPLIIMPVFNKFDPLEEGELKAAISEYANKIGFPLKGIYRMDGSKRSSKPNAFFTGIGRSRRIVLFDTLIESQTIDEIVAVLAHEMGHFKKKHITKQIVFSMISTGITLFIMSFFITSKPLANGFGIEEPTVYIGLMLFFLIYSPVTFFSGIISSMLSRRNEFEADRFASDTTGKPEDLATALKKLSKNSLTNLTPHPLKVFIEYSHPPIIDRLNRLKEK